MCSRSARSVSPMYIFSLEYTSPPRQQQKRLAETETKGGMTKKGGCYKVAVPVSPEMFH